MSNEAVEALHAIRAGYAEALDIVPEEAEPTRDAGAEQILDATTVGVLGQFIKPERRIQNTQTGAWAQVYTFKVQATEPAPNENPSLLDRIIRIIVEEALAWAVEQMKQGSIKTAELKLEPIGPDVYVAVEVHSRHRLALNMSTEWNDTLVVFVGDKAHVYRPGEGRRNITYQLAVTGPGALHVRIINTQGKPYELIGNWSIDVTWALEIDGQAMPGAQGRISGWEPRGREWTYGPFPYGLKPPS